MTKLALVLWWGRQRRDRRSGLRGYDQSWTAVGGGWLRAESRGVRRRIVVEYMFEGHCRGGGRGQGCVQRWELINRFASVDCWTACEAPGDDTLETTSQEGPVEELLNGAKCKRRRGVLSVSGDGRGRCGGRGGRWEEESRRNDEGPGPKSDGLAAICPASESHRIRVATNMSIALFGIPIAAPSLHHRVTSPCHTPDLGPCATSVAYPPLQSYRTWHRRTRNSSPPTMAEYYGPLF